MTPGSWTVVVPVKAPARGKSRLGGTATFRAALAQAIALDTLAAVRACDRVERVLVVTDDPDLPLRAADIPSLRFVPEGPPRGLNEAIATGMAEAPPDGLRAALLGDLPSLRPDDLAMALHAAAGTDRAVVPDAEGTGSTLVTARGGVPWASAFGTESYSRHRGLGCVPLTAPATLRQDVDTTAQLDAARLLGLGPRTTALLAQL